MAIMTVWSNLERLEKIGGMDEARDLWSSRPEVLDPTPPEIARVDVMMWHRLEFEWADDQSEKPHRMNFVRSD